MALTSKQKIEVNMSIMGYFNSQKWDEVAREFAEECPAAKYKTEEEKKYLLNLERKWRSIIRLNQKIATLEEENETLQDTLDSFKSGTMVDTKESLPKKVKYTLEGHREQVRCIQFNPMPTVPQLASCSEDSTVIIWDFTSGRILKTLNKHKNPVEWVAFSPKGDFLLSCGEDTKVIVWDMKTFAQVGKPIAAAEHTVSCVLWDASGDYFYTTSRDKSVKKWQFENRRQLKNYNENEDGHTDWVKSIIISPDGKKLATAGLDQVVTIWDEASGEIIWQFRDHENAIESIAFSCSAQCDAYIIDHCLAEEPSDQKLAKQKKNELKEDLGGMFLASASRDKSIMIWFIVSGVCVKTIKGHDTWVRSVIFHPSGRYLLSASDDKSIRVWDIKKNFRIHLKKTDAHESFILCMAWHKALASMATGGQENEIKIWECK